MFFIQGSGQTIFRDFGCDALIDSKSTDLKVIKKDIPRTPFLGSAAEWELHYSKWAALSEQTPDYYTQGDMSSGNLFLIYGTMPFKKNVETLNHYAQQLTKINFAFVNNQGVLCGMSLCCRKDDPSYWLVALTLNTHLPPDKRDVYILSNANPDDCQFIQMSQNPNEMEDEALMNLLKYRAAYILFNNQLFYVNNYFKITPLIVDDKEFIELKELFPITQNVLKNIPPKIRERIRAITDHPLTSRISEVPVSDSFLEKTLLDKVCSPLIEALLKQVISNQGKCHPYAEVIDLCLEHAGENKPYPDNQSLLDFLLINSDKILNNKLLQKMCLMNLEPTAVQILSCFDEQSDLFQILDELYALTDMDEFLLNMHLHLVVKLDQLDLLEQYQSFKQDRTFIELLHHHLFWESYPFFKACLQNETSTQALRFIAKSTHSNEFVSSLIEKPLVSTRVWENLASKELACLTEDFWLTIGCQLQLDLPDIPLSELLALIEELRQLPELAEFFLPRILASYVAKIPDEKRVSQIAHMNLYFGEILIKLNQARALRNRSLAPEVLLNFGNNYLQNPERNFDEILAFCETEQQLRACIILLELNMDRIRILSILINPALVSMICHADELQLKQFIPDILTTNWKILAIAEFYKWPASSDRKACLILMIHDAIRADQLWPLHKLFTEYPYLSALVIKLYQSGKTADFLYEFCFDPIRHQAIHLLKAEDIEFDLDRLTPEVCQLILTSAHLLKINKHPHLLKPCFDLTLPFLYQFADEKPDYPYLLLKLHQQIDSLKDEAVNKAQTPLLTPLKDLFEAHLTVCQQAQAYALPVSSILPSLRKTTLLAHALKALKGQDMDSKIKLALLQQLYIGFAALEDNPNLNEHISNQALQALTIYYSDSDSDSDSDGLLAVEKPYPDFKALITTPSLALAILVLHQHQLPLKPLLDLHPEKQQKILPLINYLNQNTVNNQDEYYQLGVQSAHEGNFDFLHMLVWISKNILPDERPLAVDLLVNTSKAIQEKTPEVFKSYLYPFSLPNAERYGSETGIRLLLINRLNELKVDKKMISCLLEDSERGKKFFSLVLKVEDQCEKLRNRLSRKSDTKFALYLEPERTYRAELYQLAFQSLTSQPPVQFAQEIARIEAPLLKIADQDRHPWIRKILSAITNTLGIIPGGIPLFIHKYQTGDFLFFSHTVTSNGIRQLDRNVTNILLAPIA